MTDTLLGPCKICGATGYSLSYGGSDICPACDCGIDPQIIRLRRQVESQAAEIERLKEDAEARRNSIEMVMDARNELSDLINTWNGMGINDDRLYKALDDILDMLDNAGLRRSDAAKSTEQKEEK